MKPADQKIDGEWLRLPQTRSVIDALQAGGAPARFVGGCVRNALFGEDVTDIDIATPEKPDRVIELLEQAGLKAVATGIEHGTVTAVADHKPFEVTTLRVDVETYGRHADVAFTKDWIADAERRDFTINALYADSDGTVFDPVGGLADIEKRRVRFIGDASSRIEEDGLRILRFYRFYAQYGDGEPDGEGRKACIAHRKMLGALSAERIWSEMQKLLAARRAADALKAMSEDAILSEILPEAGSFGCLERLCSIEKKKRLSDPVRRLAALLYGQQKNAAQAVARRWKLSNADKERLCDLVTSERLPADLDERAMRAQIYRDGKIRFRDRVFLSWAADGEDRAYQLDYSARWPVPDFPVSGKHLLKLGIDEGPEVGRTLAELEKWWIEQDFEPDREALLKRAGLH